MKIYLDVCCLNRPLDDQNQPRIRLEAEAIVFILHRLHLRDWEWFSSDVVALEIDQTPDIFLTTDDKLLKLATRLSSQLQVKVANPVFWLLENL